MKNLKEQQQMMTGLPVNGVSMIPDGKSELMPTPIVTADNYAKARVPTTVAAMAGAFTNNMQSQGSSEQSNQPEYNEEEEEEEENENYEGSSAEGVAEETSEQFRNALISLLGEHVSEETIEQLEGIFEAAVTERVENKLASIVSQLDENVHSYLDTVTNTLVEKVDDYLDYVVEEWMQDNTISVEQGIKTQIAENFISGLKNLFENHYIDVPDEKYNALDELYAQNRQLEESLNNSINENLNIKKNLMLNECATIFVAETRDLADTQIEKLQSLMENVSFNDVDEYRSKLVGIKNNYLAPQPIYSRPVAQPINEEMTFSAVKPLGTTTVENYASIIGKLNKKI